jgi:hypothetical protein
MYVLCFQTVFEVVKEGRILHFESGYRRFEVWKRKLTIQGIENPRQQLKTEYYEKEIPGPIEVNTDFRYIDEIP